LIALLLCGTSEFAHAQNQSSVADPAVPKETSRVTPPSLLTRVDPEYPKQALEEQRTGVVILQLEISETGQVTSAVVAEGAGFGMDEAAQAAALKLVFQPAMRGETPIKSRILYKMNFDLKPAPAPETLENPSMAAVPLRANIRGVVRFESEAAAGVGVQVKVQAADGSTLQTTTNESGVWELSELPPGKVKVTIESPGFSPYIGEEMLGSGERLEVTYRLHAESDALEVIVKGERTDREVTRRTIERSELSVVPGTSGDALKVLESMPGVARTPAFSGTVVIRGSSPYGTQYFVDGTFVPAIYHFGGLSSVVPTEMIESVDFYPGNFSAKYGRVTGGIIDVKLREMDYDGKYHGMAQVDFIDARLMLRGPVPLAKKWAFNFGLRRSHLDAWIGSVMSEEAGFRTAPVYYDWQGFVETKPTARSVFRFGIFGADDRVEAIFKKAMANEPGMGSSFKANQRTARLQAIYRNQITDALGVNLTASVGLDREYVRFGSLSSVEGNYVPIIARGDMSYRWSKQWLARVGPDVIVYKYDVDVLSIRPPEPGETEGSHANRPMLKYDGKGYFSAPAAFAELEWTPNQKAKVLLGGRLDYFSLTKRWDYSPRVNARYDLHSGPQRTTLKGGFGLFSEPPQIVQSIEPFGTPTLKSNRSIHSSLGIEQVISDQVEVSIEGFHKYLDNVVVATAFDDGSNGYSNVGKGQVYGTETMVRWKPGGRFFGWIAYTLSRSTRKPSPDEPTRVYEYDQTHNLTVLGSYDLGKGYRIGGKFRLVSGNPYTPCQGGVINAAAGSYECIQGEVNSRRIPAFHQLDIRFDKAWTFKDFKVTTYLDVQNVYNRSNADGVSYNYRYTKPEWQVGLPIIPSLGVRGDF
jgi:TonB family protein